MNRLIFLGLYGLKLRSGPVLASIFIPYFHAPFCYCTTKCRTYNICMSKSCNSLWVRHGESAGDARRLSGRATRENFYRCPE
jgi:hypothetical protein